MSKDLLVHRESQGLLVPRALKEIKAIRVNKDLKDSPELTGHKDPRATREILVQQVLPAPKVIRATGGYRANQDLRVRQVHGDLKASPVLLAHKGREGPRVNKDRRGPVDR